MPNKAFAPEISNKMNPNSSVNIKLPRAIKNNKEKIKEWERLWEEVDNVSYSIPNLTIDEIRVYFSLFLSRLPSKFANAVLGDLAELNETPWDLLEVLFESGDTGCKVAICCRPDLPDHMLRKCLDSPIPDVLEHVVFHKKVTIQECESLLERHLEKSTVDAIQRALVRKEGDRLGYCYADAKKL